MSTGRRDVIDLICSECGSEFKRHYRISAKRKAKPQFCSRLCVANSKRKTRQLIATRFWRNVAVSGANECWNWIGRLDPNGYGRLDADRRPQLAHRIAYAISNPNIPLPEAVCHSCDNPKCCNPRHLWPGTQLDNIADMDSKGRRRLPPVRRGAEASNTKLDAVRAIEAVSSSLTNVQLATKWGVTPTAIYNIRAGLSWSHVTGVKRNAQ